MHDTTPDNGDSERLVSAREAARRLGLSEITLAQWRAAARGPRFYKLGGDAGKPGRSVRYRISDLEAWLASCSVGGAAAGQR